MPDTDPISALRGAISAAAEIAEALRRLSYPNEARVVDKAQQVLGA